MPRIAKIEPKTFAKDIAKYQRSLRYGTFGRAAVAALSEALGREPEDREVAFVRAIKLIARHNDKPATSPQEAARDYLFAWVSQYKANQFKRGSIQADWMADFTKEVILPLQEQAIVHVTYHRQGQCRRYQLRKDFNEMLDEHLAKTVLEVEHYSDRNLSQVACGSTPSTKPTGNKNPPRLLDPERYKPHPLTVAAWQHVRHGQFRFDWTWQISQLPIVIKWLPCSIPFSAKRSGTTPETNSSISSRLGASAGIILMLMAADSASLLVL